MPTPRTYYSRIYPVAAFLETALEAKVELKRLDRKAKELSGQVNQLDRKEGDELVRETKAILCQELIWVLEDIQRCEEQYNAVESLIDKIPFEDDRVILRSYYFHDLRGTSLSVKVEEDYHVYLGDRYLDNHLKKALEMIQSIYEMEVLCV